MHVQARLLDSVRDIRPSESDVLKRASDAAEESRVRKRVASGGQLGAGLGGCTCGVTLEHASFRDMMEERTSPEMNFKKMMPVIVVVAVEIEDDGDERGYICDGVDD